MLNPYAMSSALIAGPNEFLEDTIKELHKLKVLHIVEHSKNEMADIGKPLESANSLSEILVKVRALISALGINKGEYKYESISLYELEKNAEKLNQQVKSLLDYLRKTEELVLKYKAIRDELEILGKTDIQLDAFTNYKSLAYFTGYAKDKKVLHSIKDELSKATGKFMIFDGINEKKIFMALFVDIKNKNTAQSILQKFNFIAVNFSHISNLNGDARSNLEKIKSEQSKNDKLREEIKTHLLQIGNDFSDFLLAADDFLSEQLEKAEAPLRFASTTSSFLIKGWIPTQELKDVIERLNKATKNKLYIYFQPADKKDKVPVKMNNPRIAKSFEFFMDLYSIPAYGEIDPTFFVFLTFPIFFGIMLGDVGYGLISLTIFFILRKIMPNARKFFNILILSSFVTILFGLFFGEFFGFEFIKPIISREHEIFKLLYLAIAIGVVHINIGLILGFFNELRFHGLVQAIYTKISWFVLEIGAAITILSVLNKISFSLFGISSVRLPFFDLVSLSTLTGFSIIIISLAMLFRGEGIRGLIESISILTNTMSYARLMAIGLSSVIMAAIVNEQSSEFFHKGGFFVLIGGIILIIGHIINIMLGLLGSFLHSLRLHYVEFFSKFLHGGAKKYQPFGSKNF